MTFCRAKEAGFASKLFLRWGISLAGAVLIATVFGVPSASATLVGEAAGAPKSVVPPATGTSAPSLPSAAPAAPQTPVPTAPQVPIKVPTAPQAPPVKVPGTTPTPSHLVPAPSGGSSPGVDLPSVDRMASGAKETAGTATSTSTEGVQQAAVSARSGGGKGSTGPGSTGETRPRIGARSVELAKAAPLRRLLAYVWPAIALGPAGKLLAALQARWEAATSLSVSNATRFLSGLTGTGVGGAAELSKRSAASNPSPADSTNISLPGGGGISLVIFIISSAALMGWLIFSIRRELGSMYRWPH